MLNSTQVEVVVEVGVEVGKNRDHLRSMPVNKNAHAKISQSIGVARSTKVL